MKISLRHLSIWPLLLAGALAVQGGVYRRDLPSQWQFRQQRKVATHPATVPGTVHTDLMANGMIPDPFVGENEREVQWVDKEDWVYETIFTPDPATMAAGRTDIVFEGLDTYADVYLNDSLIIRADNMFRTWERPVERLLKPGVNTLRVYFHSPVKVDMPKFDALTFQYDAGNDQAQNGGLIDKRLSVFARKAGYHYGWDWGPRLVTSGIWRPVYLRSWSDARISDLFIRTLTVSAEKAGMQAVVEVNSDLRDAPAEIVLTDERSGRRLASVKTVLKQGVNTVTLPFVVKNPELWWCNGMGEPKLHDFKAEVRLGKAVADSMSKRTGIRTVELVQDEDSCGGRSFYFKLNGVPVFAKGANYIPCDNFLPRVTDEVYRRTVQDAADANMNMLRVWGGGVYEDNRFYELCDSLGIMVWQDFMYACSFYPSEGELLENMRLEAIDNVRRLRSHPSIVIWCGNNECLEAWFGWGLKRRYEAQGVADIIWKQYLDLYHGVLPEVMASEAPGAVYHPSSPFSRVDGRPEPHRGDYHLWTVWGGERPISDYNGFRSRFFSEYGFQSFPELPAVLKYAPDPAQHFIDSDVMLAHQRAGAGANRKIERYLLESYPRPKDFESLLYMTQILQGDAIKTAMEAHRRDRPYCMGSLYWQHNDCWPVASWSSRDYFGNRKAQHYFAAKAFRDILVSPLLRGDSIEVSVVSDRPGPIGGRLTVSSRRLDGTELASHGFDITVDEVERVTLPVSALYAPADSADVFITASFGDDYENILLPSAMKYMRFTLPEVRISVEPVAEGKYAVRVSADRFVRAFRMALPADDSARFADNYFDIIPGREYVVALTTDSAVAPPDITWTSLYNASSH